MLYLLCLGTKVCRCHRCLFCTSSTQEENFQSCVSILHLYTIYTVSSSLWFIQYCITTTSCHELDEGDFTNTTIPKCGRRRRKPYFEYLRQRLMEVILLKYVWTYQPPPILHRGVGIYSSRLKATSIIDEFKNIRCINGLIVGSLYRIMNLFMGVYCVY